MIFVAKGYLAYRPKQALHSVKQIFQDSNGNEVGLTMNQYTTNVLKAWEYLIKSCFEVDVAMYAADNMDPAVT